MRVRLRIPSGPDAWDESHGDFKPTTTVEEVVATLLPPSAEAGAVFFRGRLVPGTTRVGEVHLGAGGLTLVLAQRGEGAPVAGERGGVGGGRGEGDTRPHISSDPISSLATSAGDGGDAVIAAPTHWPLPLRHSLRDVLAAWRAGDADCVTLSRDGEGGTYFLHGPRDGGDGDSGAGGSDAPYVACFKPRDEEAGAPANPKRLQGAFGMPQARMGVLSGESWAREVAAFLLDHGIAGVPATGAVEARHPAFHYVPTSPTLGPLAPVDSRSASPRLATKLGSWQVRGGPAKPRSACPPSQRARE
jgi:hypothetical protein